MDFSSFEFSEVIVYAVVGVFWLGVLGQWIARRREVKQIEKSVHCPNCDGRKFTTDLYVVNLKTNNKVSLLKNIGGAYLALMIGGVLLYMAYRQINDLIVGSNITGIQDVSLKGKLAWIGGPLTFGGSLALVGILLLIDFFIGKKEKIINLTCDACQAEYSMAEDVLTQTGAGSSLISRNIGTCSPNPAALTATSGEVAAGTAGVPKESSETCSKCGMETKASDFTCPHCGHTQWEVIAFMGAISLGMIGFVVIRIIKELASGWLFWGAVIIGLIILAVTIESISEAVKGARTHSPKS